MAYCSGYNMATIRVLPINWELGNWGVFHYWDWVLGFEHPITQLMQMREKYQKLANFGQILSEFLKTTTV